LLLLRLLLLGCRPGSLLLESVLVFRVVPVGVSEGNVGSGASLLGVDWLIQIVVDEEVLRALRADVVVRGRHADQVHLRTQSNTNYSLN